MNDEIILDNNIEFNCSNYIRLTYYCKWGNNCNKNFIEEHSYSGVDEFIANCPYKEKCNSKECFRTYNDAFAMDERFVAIANEFMKYFTVTVLEKDGKPIKNEDGGYYILLEQCNDKYEQQIANIPDT